MMIVQQWAISLMRPVLVLALSVSASAIDAGMIDKEGMQSWEVCALCHSADGISRMAKFPKLAGQKAQYIEQQFFRFKQGSRQNDGGQMQAITTEIEDADVEQIAVYFSSLSADTLQVNADEFGQLEKQWVARGKALFYEGKSGVRACAQCHTNSASSAPWIDRQHRDYLKKQLQDFKSGERAVSIVSANEEVTTEVAKVNSSVVFTDEAAVMGNISMRLSEVDIDALSFYLSVTSIVRD